MKIKIAALSLLACLAAGANAQTQPGDEFVGTWKSPQMVDTTLQISRTIDGRYHVQQDQRNTFGGAQITARYAELVKPGMLRVGGTTVYDYDGAAGLIVIMVAPNVYATFARQPQ